TFPTSPEWANLTPRGGGVESLRTRVQDVCEALASLFFPAPCRLCGEALDTASRIPVCRSCLASLQSLRGPCCTRCGRPFASWVAIEVETCPSATSAAAAFTTLISLAVMGLTPHPWRARLCS